MDKQNIINIFTIGSPESGKTTLASALSALGSTPGSVDGLSRPTVEQRGDKVEIESSVVEFSSSTRSYRLYDMNSPSTEKKLLVDDMSMSCALFVAAGDGITEDVKTTIRMARDARVPKLIVVHNVFPEQNEPEIFEAIEGDFLKALTTSWISLADIPVVRGSALLAKNKDPGDFGQKFLEKLLASLDREVGNIEGSRKPAEMGDRKAFNAWIYVLTGKEGGRTKPFYGNYKLRFEFTRKGTGRLFDFGIGTIELCEPTLKVNPGESVLVKITLDTQMLLLEGEQFKGYEGEAQVLAGRIVDLI